MDNQTSAGTGRSTTEKVKNRVGEATDTVQEKASHVAAEARDRGGELIEEGREKAHELSDRAGSMARSRAAQEKERLTNGMRTFADVLRRGSDDLTTDRDQYRPLLNGAADRVESASRYLEQRDVDAITADVRRFAREHTPLFVGGALALGFAGARFLKSSGDQASRNRMVNQPSEYGRVDRFDRMLPESGTEGRTGSAAFQDRGSAGTTGFQDRGSVGSTFQDRGGSTGFEDRGGVTGGTYE